MKTFSINTNNVLFRFDKDEDVIAALSKYSKSKKTVGHFTCIGSTKEVILSYYNLKTKQFEDHHIQEDLEVISVTGNISYMDNTPVIHVHGVFSKRDLSTIGGHIKKLIVSATCEVYLHAFPEQIKRSFDSDTGLNLLSN